MIKIKNNYFYNLLSLLYITTPNISYANINNLDNQCIKYDTNEYYKFVKQNKLIAYGTKEFEEFISTQHKVTLWESKSIAINYYNANKKTLKFYSPDIVFYIIDNNYVYVPLNKNYDKMNEYSIFSTYYISGIWVNSDTKEVKMVKNQISFYGKNVQGCIPNEKNKCYVLKTKTPKFLNSNCINDLETTLYEDFIIFFYDLLKYIKKVF